MAMSEMLAIRFWFRNADSNASAQRTFCIKDLRVPALASRSVWSASFAIPLMSWSLMYMSESSCSHEGHVKSQSKAVALKRTRSLCILSFSLCNTETKLRR